MKIIKINTNKNKSHEKQRKPKKYSIKLIDMPIVYGVNVYITPYMPFGRRTASALLIQDPRNDSRRENRSLRLM